MLSAVQLRGERAHLASRGFSLIELIVVMAIFALVMALGAPELSNYMANSRVRAAAEGFAIGLQSARAEAVRQNRPVQFALTANPAPIAANVNSITPSSTGDSWIVRLSEDPTTPEAGTFSFVDGKSATEGSGSGQTSRVNVAATRGGNPLSTIVFMPLGDIAPTAGVTTPVTIAFSHVGLQCASATEGAGGPIRCLNVRVSAGGRTQVCDPLAQPGDTRSCG